MWQSLRIIEQAYRKIQDFKGEEATIFHADVPEYYLPEKKDVYTKMEALIYHFKIVTEGIRVPAGEVYQCIESPRGEIGYYVVSDGSSKASNNLPAQTSFTLQAIARADAILAALSCILAIKGSG